MYVTRYIFMLLMCFIVSGCSTVYTLNNADDGLVMKGSYCKSIDHIFSGVEYNWCKLNGTPNTRTDPNSSKGEFEYVGIDSFFSFIADVVVLPYTIYKQISAEPIAIRTSNSAR